MRLENRVPAPSVAHFLRQVKPRILSEWERSVRDSVPKPLTEPALLDHVPDLLLELADRLEHPADARHPTPVTKKHAAARLDLGFDLRAVISEYAELRRCILRLWDSEVGARGRPGEIETLNLAIDEAMLESVTRFTQAHQRTLEALDRLSLLALDAADPEGFLGKLLVAFKENAEAVDAAALFLMEGDQLRLRAAVGVDLAPVVKIGDRFVGKVAAERRPLEVRREAACVTDQLQWGPEMKMVYGVPLLHGEELVGVAYVGSRTAPEFSGGDRQLLRALATRATTLIVRRAEQDERERLYGKARDAVRARNDFISIASHELNNPLHALQLQVELLLRGGRAAQKEPWEQSKLKGIQRQIGRLVNLVRSLLDFSRIETQHVEIDRQEVDLAQIVRDVVAQHEEELRRSGYSLSIVAAAPIVGQWDSLRLEQIVTNLLSNAMKYGEHNPIEICVEAKVGVARLVVRDHGIGIGPGDLARIFDRFERAAPTRAAAGLGLGLWIVRQLVEAMDGRVSVISQPGAGSTFTVELPLGAPGPGAGDRTS